MDSFRALIEILGGPHDENHLLTEYVSSFDEIVRTVEPNLIYEAIRTIPNELFVLSSLYTAALCHNKKYQEAYDLLANLDLTGSDRAADQYNGRLLRCYYLCMKSLNMGMDPLYKLLVSNREYGNEYSIAILTNSILEHQINNNVYLLPDQNILSVPLSSDSVEGSRYSFYLGVIRLVRGEYMEGLESFNRADILNKDMEFEMQLRKYVIVTKLLLGDYSLYYPYSDELRPYFSLIGVVRRAELSNFYEVLKMFQVEFFSMRLYFVVRRLLSNLLREGLRKISVCYSRISVEDISRIVGVNADYLIHHAIKSGFIGGYVDDGIYYGENKGEEQTEGYGKRIRETVAVRRMISGMMRYPPIEPLTYERILEQEKKYSN